MVNGQWSILRQNSPRGMTASFTATCRLLKLIPRNVSVGGEGYSIGILNLKVIAE